jgi:transposase
MIPKGPCGQIYLAMGATDMRKAINGLSILVQQRFGLNPLGADYFVFCNRKRTLVKILYWDRNGFCLWQKRLERHRFLWPRTEEEVLHIERRQLQWLLAGLDIRQAHEELKYERVV